MNKPATTIDANSLCQQYLHSITEHLQRILREESESMDQAASLIADQIAADRLVHVFGPGGHSNLAAQEIFFRAGGLMHVSAILDEGTLLSNGALRSMAMERTPGYGRIVIRDHQLDDKDLLILVNAYGINTALIDAALEAKARGVTLIGVNSHEHADGTNADHPARHPEKYNLHELVDVAVDCKVPIGDSIVQIGNMHERIAAVSTFANAYTLNCLIIHTVAKLLDRGVEPPVWRSGNAPGGDEANARFINRFNRRVKSL